MFDKNWYHFEGECHDFDNCNPGPHHNPYTKSNLDRAYNPSSPGEGDNAATAFSSPTVERNTSGKSTGTSDHDSSDNSDDEWDAYIQDNAATAFSFPTAERNASGNSTGANDPDSSDDYASVDLDEYRKNTEKSDPSPGSLSTVIYPSLCFTIP